LDVAID
jgi:putative tryptophan/tyrosine transport system substrate-binding protein